MTARVFAFRARRPMSQSTRAAVITEFLVARAERDVFRGRDLYRLAMDHDAAWPDEPSLHDELLGLHSDDILAEVSSHLPEAA